MQALRATLYRAGDVFGSTRVQGFALTLFLGLISFFVLTPLFFLFLSSFQVGAPGAPLAYGIEGWKAAVTSPGILAAIGNSFSLAVTRQLFATVIGIFIAWLLARTDLPIKGRLEFFFWVSYFIPSLPVALGWMLLLDPRDGLINRWLLLLPFINEAPFNIFSFWGIVWVHLSASTLAIKVMLLTPAFRNLDAALEESSRVCGAGALQTLFKVVVPIMMPPILVALTLGLIRSLEAFEIELILGVPVGIHVFATKIYSFMVTEPPQFPEAAALGTFFLVVLLGLIVFQKYLLAGRAFTTITGKGFSTRPVSLGRWKTPAFMFVVTAALFTSVVPTIFLVVGTFMKLFGFFDIEEPWTLDNWRRVLSDPVFLQSLKNTLILGFSTAAVGICLSSVISYIIVKSKFAGRAILDFISWLPWAIPGILIGIALLSTLLLIQPVIPIHGTMFALIIAMSLSSLPLSVQILKSYLMQIGNELEEASEVAGASWVVTFRRILFPLLLPCLIVIGLLEFIAAARNVSSVILLATGRTRTLAILMMDFALSDDLEAATVVATIIVLLVVGAAFAARRLGGELTSR